MGYAEEAKINLGKARTAGNADPLALAQVYASLAVLEALDEVAGQLGYLSQSIDIQIEAAKKQ